MELTLSVLRCPDSVVPETRQVPGGEYRIGRGADCDWVLPDPDRVLSKHHCVLEFRSGGWQVRDCSTNGTFHNGASMPVGRDQVALLQDGDRIRMGSYEIEVRVAQAGAQPGWGGAAPAADPWPPTGQAQPGAWDAPLPTTPTWDAEPAWGAAPQGQGGRPEPIQPRLPGDAFPIGGPEPAPFGGPAGSGGMIPADFRLDDGPAMPDHAPVTSEPFLVPKPMQASNQVLPDDWSRPLSGTAPQPGPTPAIGAPAQPLPETWNLGFGDAAPVGAPSVAPNPPAVTPPPVGVSGPTPAAHNPFDQEIALGGPVAAPGSGMPVPPPPPPPPIEPVVPAVAAPIMAPPPTRPVEAVPSPGGEGALGAFLAGAGLAATPTLTANPDATLQAAGAALRAAIAGLRALLIARGDVKREFRIEQTMLGSAGNNPVKFSHNDDAALTALLGASAQGPRAVQETVDDLTAHQLATLAATQAAARALLERMAPAGLEAAEKGGGLFGASREKRLWEGYKRLHDQVSQQFDDDFDSAFGKAFARAYEQALRDGRR